MTLNRTVKYALYQTLNLIGCF